MAVRKTLKHLTKKEFLKKVISPRTPPKEWRSASAEDRPACAKERRKQQTYRQHRSTSH
jgi:hypothetical protein